jgi:hypothetical protein
MSNWLLVKDLYHPWSNSPDTYLDYLIKNIMPQQTVNNAIFMTNHNRNCLPTSTLNSWGKEHLICMILNINMTKNSSLLVIRNSNAIDGELDRFKKLQSLCSNVEQLWMYTEEYGKIVPQWYQDTVVAVKSMNKDHIE